MGALSFFSRQNDFDVATPRMRGRLKHRGAACMRLPSPMRSQAAYTALAALLVKINDFHLQDVWYAML